jgi:hypothetical protein
MLSIDEGFEKFSVYGFSIVYPKECRVEFNYKSMRTAGDVIFHFPNELKVFLSWGELDRATKSYETVEKQAEHSVDVLRKTRSVKNLERLAQDSLDVNRHRGVFTRVTLVEVSPNLLITSRSSRREAVSVHVHCPESARYFVIYSMLPENNAAYYAKTLTSMAVSLMCH